MIQGAPHDMPKKYFDKLPKFNGLLVIPIEEHIESVWNYMDAYGAEAEDVYMVALKASLEGDARGWFDRLPPGSVHGYDTFTKKLIEYCSSKLDNRFLLNDLFEVTKKENEKIQDFNLIFDKLVSNVPQDLRPTKQVIVILYLNAFEGWFGLNLKEKNPNDLKTAQTWAKKAEANIASMGKKEFL